MADSAAGGDAGHGRFVRAHPAAMVARQERAVSETLKGIRRTLGTAPTRKSPLLTADLRTIVRGLPATKLIAVRDRALLTLGLASALRRSELAALELRDLTFTADGVELLIRRSKTDQEAPAGRSASRSGARPRPVRCVR